jgi:crotonobetainyl-CoA:carnitine CoA-transferase CaiB-like acyl-CoA transferase
MSAKALEGIRVLDLTRLLPGAIATRWLADFGAEVIKIEQPPLGDYARYSFDGTKANPVFEPTNRGKKSVVLDLKDQNGKDAFLQLVRESDILIEGFRPGVMDRLGLGYNSLAAENPRLIYASLTGYGSQGPYAQLAGHDINYLALAGVLDLIGPKGGAPVIPGVQIADLAGGSQSAILGILLALMVRYRTGRGQRVEVSMFAGSSALMAIPEAGYNSSDQPPQRGSELLNGGFACYQVYPAAKGSYVAVGALEPRFWGNLCRELGCENLIMEQFAADQGPVIAAIAAKFTGATAEQWFERLGHKDCCVTPVRNLKDAIRDYSTDPQPVLSETPGRAGARAPRLGEHGRPRGI